MKKNYGLIVLLLTVCLVSPLKAQSESEIEESMGGQVVFSTRLLPELKKESAHTVEVIRGEDLQNRGDRSVAEALREIPGAFLLSLGTRGETNKIRLRGTDSESVLVLLDGVRINSPLDNDSDLGFLPVDLIDRIEVLKGSQAVLYGGSALSGVIAIYTKKGQDPDEARMSFELGNLGHKRGVFQLRGKTGPAAYALSFSQTDTDGQFDNDYFQERVLSQRWDFDISKKLDLTVTSYLIFQRKGLARGFLIGPAAFYDPDLDPSAFFIQIEPDTNRLAKQFKTVESLTLAYQWTESIKTELRYGFFYEAGREENPAGNSPGVLTPSGLVLAPNSVINDIEVMRHHVDLRQLVNLPDLGPLEHSVVAGFEFYDERIRAYGEGPIAGDTPAPAGSVGPFIPPVETIPSADIPGDRQNYAPYLQYHLAYPERFSLDMGIRWDHNSAYGGELSPRVAAAYWIPKLKGKIHGAYGEGYLPPNNLQLFNPVSGNPNLEPEKTQSYEIGYEQPIKDKATIYATFFYIDFDNLISRLGTNTADAYSRGIEAGFQWNPIRQLSLAANYTWVDSEDESSGLGQRLPNYPTHSLSASLSAKPWRSLKIDTSILWITDQLELFPLVTTDGVFIDGSPAAALDGGANPGYFLWDLALSYTFDFVEEGQAHPQALKVYGKVNNILNTQYEASFGFPSPGIHFVTGLELLF